MKSFHWTEKKRFWISDLDHPYAKLALSIQIIRSKSDSDDYWRGEESWCRISDRARTSTLLLYRNRDDLNFDLVSRRQWPSTNHSNVWNKHCMNNVHTMIGSRPLVILDGLCNKRENQERARGIVNFHANQTLQPTCKEWKHKNHRITRLIKW